MLAKRPVAGTAGVGDCSVGSADLPGDVDGGVDELVGAGVAVGVMALGVLIGAPELQATRNSPAANATADARNMPQLYRSRLRMDCGAGRSTREDGLAAAPGVRPLLPGMVLASERPYYVRGLGGFQSEERRRPRYHR